MIQTIKDIVGARGQQKMGGDIHVGITGEVVFFFVPGGIRCKEQRNRLWFCWSVFETDLDSLVNRRHKFCHVRII